jgi:methylase of polypeptide subunit release factors
MSTSDLSSEERAKLHSIVSDLQTIFDRDQIELDELRDLNLESSLVLEYLDDLRNSSEPEPALKDKLVTSASVLARAIFGRMSPEIRIENGIVDYRLKADGMPILLEIKPPFEAYERDGDIQRIDKRRLNWRNHQEQIERYKGENEYLVFTNLDEWVFFSKRQSEPIAELQFDEVYDDLQTIGELRDYLERVEGRAERGALDESFFEGLDSWRESLHELDFKDSVSEREQTEAVITFINKFIFIQTLDDHFVVNFNWIEKRWNQITRDWEHIGGEKVLEKFLSEVNDWYFAYYDTELFDEEEIDFIELLDDEKENIEEFYEILPQILGLEDWQQTSSRKGITNFNYRQIDEDIFGKAYETSLAERREEEGIYYTEKEVTRYMIEQTVGETFDEYVSDFHTAVENEEFETAKETLRGMQSLKVIDPACGSGSFLIKAFDVIWERYREIIDQLEEIEYLDFNGSLDISQEDQENAASVQELRDIVGYENDRELVAKIILRHIFGNDKDADALAVAKVNIWLESIKKVPEAFRYSNIPRGGGYTLPNLELNLQNGDALAGLPDEDAIDNLNEDHTNTLQNLSSLRNDYVSDHTQEGIADDILDEQDDLKEAVNEEFEDYLISEDLSTDIFDETIPQHWPVAFWHTYFTDDGELQENTGFDFVIGNPPYINAIARNKHFEECERDFWEHKFDESASGAYDVYLLFLQLGFDLVQDEGYVSYIVPNKHLAAPYAQGFREYLIDNENHFVSLSDVSQLNVFDDPSVYPVIPVYQANSAPDDAAIKGHSPPTKDTLGDSDYDHKHEYDYLDELDENIWSFLLLTDDSIFWDIYENCQMLKNAGTVQASSTASEAEEFTVALSEDDPDNDKKKFIKTGAIDPLLSFWEFEEIRHQGDDYGQPVLDTTHDIITDLRRDQYQKEKLVFAKVASTIEAYPDVDGSYASVDTNLFYDGDESMLYYGGILNSYVADFLYAGLFGALRMRGGDFQFQAPQLRNLSIPDINGDVDEIETLEETVGELLDRNHHRELLLNIWEEKSELLSDENRSLSTILSNDKTYIQSGNRNQAWTDSVTFYPDTDQDELTEEYPEFSAESKGTKSVLVHGVDGQSETELFEAEFDTRQLRDHVLAAMKLTLFRTRKKIECVEDILDKTKIPVVRQDSAENTQNVVDDIESSFESDAVMQHSDETVISSLGKLDEKISSLWNETNALVMELYSVSDSGIRAVLNNVDVREREKRNVIEAYQERQDD